MIIRKQEDLTEAVLGEMQRTPDARTKQILGSLVTYLHAFVREVRLTEKEFQDAIGYVNAIGQKTTPSHNEAMLMAGALGVSNLVCLLNNAQPTQANNLGPFYRAGAPRCAEGASLVRSPTPGSKLTFRGFVRTSDGKPVPGAEVDVWHSSPVGLYENQDPGQADKHADAELEAGEAAGDQADAVDLGDDVDERAGDRRDDADRAHDVAAVALGKEIGDRELPELAQVGREE